MGALRLLLVAALMAVASAIYPDDHWNYSTQLTADNFNSFVEENIAAGKTTFAPAWNAVAKAFAANKDVAFGDVNLSEARIPGNHNPGAGGWPTVRYFNKKTGLAGGNYKKKTDGAMCDELGKDEMMTAYVEEYGSTSMCNVVDKSGCSDQEVSYIEKMASKSTEMLELQSKRLDGMDPNAMKLDLAIWLGKRKKILQNLLANSEKGDEL